MSTDNIAEPPTKTPKKSKQSTVKTSKKKKVKKAKQKLQTSAAQTKTTEKKAAAKKKPVRKKLDKTIAHYHTDYTNDGVLGLSFVLLGMMAIVGSLSIFLFVQLGTAPNPLHFHINENNQFIEPVPLDQPTMDNGALRIWLTEMLMQAFSFNYSTQDKVERILQGYLDARGLETYRDLFKEERDFRGIKLRRLVSSIEILASPEILISEVVKGRYIWQISVPVKITLQNSEVTSYQVRTMDFLVWRVPETDAPVGVRVTRFSTQLQTRQGLQPVNQAPSFR